MTVQIVPSPDSNGDTASASDATSESTRMTSASYASDKAKILARLRRMEGQVRGVQRMVEEDKYCVDVLTQISSIVAAARAIGLLVLEDHIRGCVMSSHDDEAMVTELTDAIERFTRSVG